MNSSSTLQSRLIPLSRLAVTVVIVLIGFVLVDASVALACPSCKEALSAADASQQQMAKGISYSIMFMLGMPFMLISGFSLHMYRLVNRAKAEKAAQVAAGQSTDLPPS
ncbi:MAG: hypothetical protein SGJ20_13270 [Planctomycetota bacterium]|nr:hypothetical protein [Planctomycetota bacterium]